VLQFEELETLVGEPLPEAARASADWWFSAWPPDANQWRVESVYLHTGIVTFRWLG